MLEGNCCTVNPRVQLRHSMWIQEVGGLCSKYPVHTCWPKLLCDGIWLLPVLCHFCVKSFKFNMNFKLCVFWRDPPRCFCNQIHEHIYFFLHNFAQFNKAHTELLMLAAVPPLPCVGSFLIFLCLDYSKYVTKTLPQSVPMNSSVSALKIFCCLEDSMCTILAMIWLVHKTVVLCFILLNYA